MDQTYMKERPILPLVIAMALPMTISMLVNALYNIVDSIFVARISENAMTALSLVYPIQNLINAVTVGFAIGINAVISFQLGAGNRQEADRAASLGVLLNAVHGLLLNVICILLLRPFLGLFSDNEEVISLGIRYATITLSFSIPIAISISFEKIFQAAGRMTVSMVSMLLGCITNIILDPIMIFGIGPVPAMGIQGAAIATGIGQVTSLVIYLIFYFCSPLPVSVRFSQMRPTRQLMVRLYAIGVPATLNLALPSLLVSVLNGILAAFSQSYVLVLGAYYKLQTFLYLTANGVVQGMRPLIGYNYGAGEKKRVSRIFSTALMLILGVMAIGTVLCLAIPGTLIGLFTSNPDTIRLGAQALRIISLGFLVSSVSVTTSGALEGLGKGGPSLVISLMRYLIVILPLALLLCRVIGIGPTGVWHAMWLTEMITAAASWFIYKKSVRL